MSGSTLTAALSAPYTSPWSFSTSGGGGSGTWADSTNSTFTVGSHPFTTGDVIYVKLFNNALALTTPNGKYYAIVVNSTQLRYASTLSNALNGVALSIPASLSTVVQSAIGNHPFIGYVPEMQNAFYNPSLWMSSSVSLVSFASTQNVRIDFAMSSNANLPMSVAIATKSVGTSGSYVCGFAQADSQQSVVGEAVGTGFYTFGNYIQNTSQTLPAVARFTLQNRRVSTAIRLNNGTYFTRFTGSLLPTSQEPLFFVANMGINGYNVNNCTITYL
jgi:hypothetical protein